MFGRDFSDKIERVTVGNSMAMLAVMVSLCFLNLLSNAIVALKLAEIDTVQLHWILGISNVMQFVVLGIVFCFVCPKSDNSKKGLIW